LALKKKRQQLASKSQRSNISNIQLGLFYYSLLHIALFGVLLFSSEKTLGWQVV
jgi:hypothetical protein